MTKVSLLLITFWAFSGCLQTRSDIKEAEASQNLQNQLSVMQKNNADYVSRVEESLENHRQLSGRMEVIENKLNKIENSDSQKRSEDTRQVADLSQKVVLIQEALTKLENDIQGLRSDLLTMKSNPATSKVKSSANGAEPESLKQTFESAESLFKEKKWKEAILQYDEYRNKNPKGKLNPEATYKTGVCFQELGMKDEAKTFYQEVLTKFPKSDIAKKAHIRLKGI